MSVKVKINWKNDNVISESVRIYRSDSVFASTSLPPLLTEIVGDVYEYEDLDVIENQTYFYMLSAMLDEQEVFTECFELIVGLPANYVELSLVTSNQVQTSADSLNIKEPAHNAGDVLVSVIASYYNLSLPTGYTLLAQRGQMYVVGKIFTSASLTDVNTPTNLTWGVTHNILLRPASLVSELVVDVLTGSASRPAGGTTMTFNMPLLATQAQHVGYELGVFRWHNRWGNTTEPIALDDIYSKIQSKNSGDSLGISALCSFGRKANQNDSVGGKSVKIDGLPTDPISVESITMCIYVK